MQGMKTVEYDIVYPGVTTDVEAISVEEAAKTLEELVAFTGTGLEILHVVRPTEIRYTWTAVRRDVANPPG
jgi:hypothetical protein